MPKVMPASVEPHSMANAASALRRLAVNGRRLADSSASACRFSASVIGFAFSDRYDSNACTNASMPACAATWAGNVATASGSSSATSAGFSAAWRIDIFSPRSVSVITHEPDTSEPVPAVVGIAMRGSGRVENFSMPS